MKNTRELPFAEIVRLKAPWVEEVKKIVNEYIDKLYLQLKNETEYDGVPEFMDEKFLYERFKENCYTNMWNGNWEVLKYFILNFEIKIFKTMIGEWTFTDADKEIYEYFNNVKVYDSVKCKSSQIKVKSGSKINYEELIYCNDKYIIYYEFETNQEYTNNILQEPYFNKFIKSFDCIANIKRNCKMLSKYADEDFFTSETIYNSRTYDGCIKNGQYIKLIRSSCEKIYPGYDTKQQLSDIMQKFEDYCMAKPKYKKITNEIKELIIYMKENFKKESTEYKSLSESVKQEFEKQFE